MHLLRRRLFLRPPVFLPALLTLAAATSACPVRAQEAPSPPPPAKLLPDAPSAVLSTPAPCPVDSTPISPKADASAATPQPTCTHENSLRSIIVSTPGAHPLTSAQKGLLAFRSVANPANFAIVAMEAAVGVGTNAHSAYGPGLKGFGKVTGYSLLIETDVEFFGTYAIPSLVHEDPRYHRMPHARVPRRILHAITRTLIAEHDDGRPMPNYAAFAAYPITEELNNLFVPGLHTGGTATARRIGLDFATDPIANIIGEFLPDIARRIHVRSVLLQQFVNQMAISDIPE